jgi:hypothetical protein
MFPHPTIVMCFRKALKEILLLSFILAATELMAQSDAEDYVDFNTYCEAIFNLDILDGEYQVATFSSADDYYTGVSQDKGNPGIDPGFTTIAVEATGNWQVKIKADDFLPITGYGAIPINNLGVWCEATGIHQFGTEVTCSYQSPEAALGLQSSDITLIDLGSGNGGNQLDNQFVLHWLMGTMQGTMNPSSMFSQLSDMIFSQGNYMTTVVITMMEIP